jgi:hypothetical protein
MMTSDQSVPADRKAGAETVIRRAAEINSVRPGKRRAAQPMASVSRLEPSRVEVTRMPISTASNPIAIR